MTRGPRYVAGDGPGAARRHRALAVVIPAKDEAARIAATVRSARRSPGRPVVVVDDGSDATAGLARPAGAVVVRHPRNRGKAAAMQTGAAGGRAGDQRRAGGSPALLFIDADLEGTPVNVGGAGRRCWPATPT